MPVDRRECKMQYCSVVVRWESETGFTSLRMGCCEDGNEHCGELLDKLRNYSLFKKDSSVWN